MTSETNWEDGLFLFNIEDLKRTLGIDASTRTLAEVKNVRVDVGLQTHESVKGSIYLPERGEHRDPAHELHVTHTHTRFLPSMLDEGTHITVEGSVHLSYLGASSSSKKFKARIDLGKLEALQLARALIAAAEEIEKSERRGGQEVVQDL